MNKSAQFIFWELLAVFFLATYSYVDALIGTSTATETIIGHLIRWLWLIMMIFCFAYGFIAVSKKR